MLLVLRARAHSRPPSGLLEVETATRNVCPFVDAVLLVALFWHPRALDTENPPATGRIGMPFAYQRVRPGLGLILGMRETWTTRFTIAAARTCLNGERVYVSERESCCLLPRVAIRVWYHATCLASKPGAPGFAASVLMGSLDLIWFVGFGSGM